MTEVAKRTVAAVPEVEDIFDVNKVIAEREEKSRFQFKFGDDIFSLPPRPDVRVAALLSKGELEAGLRMMLGDAQWERLLDVDETFDSGVFSAILEQYQKHAGEDLGESKASPRSSKNTGKR